MSEDMKIGYVYKIQNTDDELLYIGSTSQPLSKRMANHRADCKKPKKCNYKIYKHMNELGIHKFSIAIVEEVKYKKNEKYGLLAAEGFWIEKFDTLRNGLNGCGVIVKQKVNTKEEYDEIWKNNRKKQQKEYSKEYCKEYHKTDKYKQYRKEYEKTDKFKQQQKEYEKTDKRKQYKKEYNKEYNQQNKLKFRCVCCNISFISITDKKKHFKTVKHNKKAVLYWRVKYNDVINSL